MACSNGAIFVGQAPLKWKLKKLPILKYQILKNMNRGKREFFYVYFKIQTPVSFLTEHALGVTYAASNTLLED